MTVVEERAAQALSLSESKAEKERARKERIASDAATTLDTTGLRTKEDLMRFIKHRRAFVGKTQAQVAKAIGVGSAEYIGLIENEKRLPDVDRWPMLAEALEVNPQELTKLYMRVMLPNVFAAFWGEDNIDLAAPGEDRKITRIPASAVEFLSKLYSLPPKRRKTVEDMLNALVTG